MGYKVIYPGTYLYAMHEDEKKRSGLNPCNDIEAEILNTEGHGIYFCVNELTSDVRQKTNLRRINAWYVDLDAGEKVEMLERLRRSPLRPSHIVETQRGYHAYWTAIDAKKENWGEVVEQRLIPYFNGDPRAKDVVRVLRVPGFKQWKRVFTGESSEPYEVKLMYTSTDAYAEAQMLKAFPKHCDAVAVKQQTFWEAAGNLDCREMLQKLSGQISSDTYSFKPNANGTEQILVNGKATSCWIDASGKIGSYDKGGPTIANWLHWYYKDWALVARALEPYVPKEGLVSKKVVVEDHAKYTKSSVMAANTLFKSIEKALDSKGQPTGITMLPAIDEALWGFQPGTCYVLAARSSVGKSAFAVTLTRIAAENGKRVLYFALESSALALSRRILSQITGISSTQLQRGIRIEDKISEIYNATEKISNLPITWVEKGGMNAASIVEACKANPCDLMIVDYIQCISGDGGYGSRHHEISASVATLKDWCIQSDTPMLLLSQLRRPNTTSKDGVPPPPSMFDLKESGDTENMADVLLLLNRPHIYDSDQPADLATVRIAKNRDGETKTVNLKWSGYTTQFMEQDAPRDGDPYVW